MLKIEIETGNASFYDGKNYSPQWELCRILEDIKHKIDVWEYGGSIMDINGNKIGEWKLD